MVPAQEGNSHLEPYQSAYKMRMLLMKPSGHGEGIRCEHVWYRSFPSWWCYQLCVPHMSYYELLVSIQEVTHNQRKVKT